METIDGVSYLTTGEVALLKTVWPKTVTNAVSSGRLKGRKIAGRVLVALSDAEEWNPKHGDASRFKTKKAKE